MNHRFVTPQWRRCFMCLLFRVTRFDAPTSRAHDGVCGGVRSLLWRPSACFLVAELAPFLLVRGAAVALMFHVPFSRITRSDAPTGRAFDGMCGGVRPLL